MNHELRYILHGDDQLSNIFRGITRSSGDANRVLGNTRSTASALRMQLKGAANEIPMVGNAMRLVKNPLVMGAAAIGLVGKGLMEASHASDEFIGNFRELQNLNLDKTRGQIRELQKDVLSTAFRKGFDANQTSMGFYDIQSVTGKYGAEVERIVERQGTFARLANANFNEWISGTGKAMANYGFGEDQLDRFNRSAYATVKMGAISYDQLAKVQSDYAGAAAAAKQDYDSANKLLTLFTIKTKSFNEAGTLTKSAFTDLFKESSIKAFEDAGVKLFDAGGKSRQVDRIMLDLNKKFASKDGDRAMTDLRNQFKGSEGLIALVQSAADQTGKLQETLKGFDSAKLDMSKMFESAENDPNKLREELQNKFKAMKVQVGLDIQPANNWFLQTKTDLLEGLHILFSSRDDLKEEYKRSRREELRNPGGQFNLSDAMGKKPGVLYEPIIGRLTQTGITPAGKKSNASTDSAVSESINTINGGGIRDNHVHVHIDKLIESQNINTQTLTEATEDIKMLVEQALIRSIQGTEQIIGNN